MPTPPRKIEQLLRQRAAELPALEAQLLGAVDKLKLARIYAEDGAAVTGGDRLESARQAVLGVLEELNTFRAPAASPAKKSTSQPEG